MQLYFSVLMRESGALAKQNIWHSICQMRYGHWATQRSDYWNASRDCGMLNCEPSFLICKLGYCYVFIHREVTRGNLRLLLEIRNRQRGQICILLPTCHFADVFIYMDITMECIRKGTGKWKSSEFNLTTKCIDMHYGHWFFQIRHASRSTFVGPRISFKET